MFYGYVILHDLLVEPHSLIQLECCHKEEEDWGTNMTYVLLMKVALLSIANNPLHMRHSFAMFK